MALVNEKGASQKSQLLFQISVCASRLRVIKRTSRRKALIMVKWQTRDNSHYNPRGKNLINKYANDQMTKKLKLADSCKLTPSQSRSETWVIKSYIHVQV